MTQDRIQKALEKAREEITQLNRKYFPNVMAEREAALAVIEVAIRHLPEPKVIQWERREIALREALHAWADAVLGDES